MFVCSAALSLVRLCVAALLAGFSVPSPSPPIMMPECAQSPRALPRLLGPYLQALPGLACACRGRRAACLELAPARWGRSDTALPKCLLLPPPAAPHPAELLSSLRSQEASKLGNKAGPEGPHAQRCNAIAKALHRDACLQLPIGLDPCILCWLLPFRPESKPLAPRQYLLVPVDKCSIDRDNPSPFSLLGHKLLCRL